MKVVVQNGVGQHGLARRDLEALLAVLPPHLFLCVSFYSASLGWTRAIRLGVG